MDTVLSETKGICTIPTTQRFCPRRAFELHFPHGDHRNCGLLIFDYDRPGSDEDVPVHMTPDFRLHVIAAADEEVCLTQNVQMVKARVFTENPYLLKTPSQFFTANEVLALLMHLLLLPHDETVLEIGKSSMTSTWNIFCIQNKEGVPCAVVVEWDYYRDQYYLDAFPIAKPISGIFKKIAVFEKR